MLHLNHELGNRGILFTSYRGVAMMNDEAWDAESAVDTGRDPQPEPLYVDLDTFRGLYAEEPLSDRAVIKGIVWRGIVIRQAGFAEGETLLDIGPAAGQATRRLTLDREGLELGAPELLRDALNNLSQVARDLIRVTPTTRGASDHRGWRIGIDGAKPEWTLPRRGRKRGVVSCQLVGHVRLLTRQAFQNAALDRLDLRQQAQPVLRPINPAADRLVVEHLAEGNEVVKTGMAAYDRDRVVELLLTPSPDRLNYLVMLGGEDIGFAHLDIENAPEGTIAWPCMCIANPMMQGRGLGTRILLALIAEADGRGLRPMIESKGNEDAVKAIAHRLGFELSGMRGNLPFYDRPG